MSRLAHAALGATELTAEKRALALRIQFEIQEARRVQQQTKCTWTEALRIAAKKP